MVQLAVLEQVLAQRIEQNLCCVVVAVVALEADVVAKQDLAAEVGLRSGSRYLWTANDVWRPGARRGT